MDKIYVRIFFSFHWYGLSNICARRFGHDVIKMMKIWSEKILSAPDGKNKWMGGIRVLTAAKQNHYKILQSETLQYCPIVC